MPFRGFTRALPLAVLLAAAGCYSMGSAQQQAESPPRSRPTQASGIDDRFALDAPLPLDDAVTVGRLDNGLTYYVRANAKPANRASLQLLVGAGSTLEDEDQLGLAHFVEHMAFNGTRNFDKHELVDYLERIGMRFGADINAYTGFDETVYMLEVPTENPEILETGFQILEDWAHQISFSPDEIEKERGVMVEEWRLGRGVAGRIRDRQLPVIFHGSRYAERLPIGDKKTLETAPAESLIEFYRDWYRPDLMAVVAVGDFAEADVIERIENHFGSIPASDTVRPRPEFQIPDHRETLSAIVTDEEATSTTITLGFKRDATASKTVGDARADLIDNLYHAMMNARLRELVREPDPPFLYGVAASSPLAPTKSLYSVSAGVRDGGIERGVSALLLEAARVDRHGFTQAELERAKINTLRSIERLWEERDKQDSNRYAGSYARHFLAQAPLPGIDFVRDLYAALLPEIELAEVNARAGQWITDDNRIILVSAPEAERAAIPGEDEILELVRATESVAVTPWVDRVRDEPLVSEVPEPGQILSEEEIPEIGATLWKLSNGVELLLKPTDLKNDEVLLRGYSPGGHSLVADEDYISAIAADSVVAEMGLGNFDRIELGKALTGKVAGVRAFIGELSEGVSGFASPEDMETLFELLYLRFTEPRRDEEAFQSYLNNLSGNLQHQEASPAFWFGKKWNEVSFAGHPRRRLLTTETLAEIDLDRALAIYRERFSDASDFLFTMVGNFDLDRVRPLAETWMASLPASHRGETFRDVEAYALPGVSEFEVRKGIEPKSTVRLSYFGFAPWSPLEDHLAGSLAQALGIRLREVLREDLGGVYGVRVTSNLRRYPKGRYNSGISFSCDPDRTRELLAAAFAEVDAFKTNGPSQDLVDKVREGQRRSRETALEENRFWLAALHLQRINQLPLPDILAYDRLVESVTIESLRDAARRYFDSSSYIQGVLSSE